MFVTNTIVYMITIQEMLPLAIFLFPASKEKLMRHSERKQFIEVEKGCRYSLDEKAASNEFLIPFIVHIFNFDNRKL
jgi:hypothetical protein